MIIVIFGFEFLFLLYRPVMTLFIVISRQYRGCVHDALVCHTNCESETITAPTVSSHARRNALPCFHTIKTLWEKLVCCTMYHVEESNLHKTSYWTHDCTCMYRAAISAGGYRGYGTAP